MIGVGKMGELEIAVALNIQACALVVRFGATVRGVLIGMALESNRWTRRLTTGHSKCVIVANV